MHPPFPLPGGAVSASCRGRSSRASSGHAGPTSPAAATEAANKPESFSYVAEPTLRFVADLPIRSESAEADSEPPSFAHSAPAAVASAVVVVDSSSPRLAGTGVGAQTTPDSPLLPATEPNHADGSSQAKRKRRMSALGSLLHHKKATTSSHGDRGARTGTAPPAPRNPVDAARTIPAPAAAVSGNGATRSREPSASATPTCVSSTEFLAQTQPAHASRGPDFFPPRARSSAGPGELDAAAVGAPPIFAPASPPPQPSSGFRSSHDSDYQRPSLAETEAFSGSSQGSLVGTSCPSVTSTAPTSPGSHMRHARGDSLDMNGLDAAGSLVKSAAPVPALEGANDEDAPASTSCLAAPIDAGLAPSRREPTVSSTSPPAYVSAAATSAASTQVPLPNGSRLSYSRSITRNIESLSLSDLRPRPNPSFASSVSTNTNDSTASIQSDSPGGTAIGGRASLRALPRLLSTSAVPMANGPMGEEEQEQEQEESETDTDADDHSDDEGETYATSDEGPVTSRTPAGTPGAVQPPPATPRAHPPSQPHPSHSSPSLRHARLPSFSRLSEAGAAGPSSSWVAFSGSTPTPGPMRSSRLTAGPGATSYFDMPRPNGSSAAKTPSAVPTTPLVPMSMSDVARGKRPEMPQEPATPPLPAHMPGGTVPSTPAAGTATTGPPEQPQEAQEGAGDVRAGLYRLRSQSVIALASPSMVDDDNEPVGTAALTGLDPIWQSGVPIKQRTPAPSFLAFSLDQPSAASPTSTAPGFTSTIKTPAALKIPQTPAPASPATPDSPSRSRMQGMATAGGYRLQRTRSMYELRVPPPPYQNAYGRPGQPAQIVEAREEEGKEGLPGYTCAIHIEGYMPRKMEFTAPGVQARDRTWRRQYFVLHGTSIKIYKYNLRTHPIPGEEDWSAVPIDIAGKDGPPPLHFHEGEYGVVRDNNPHHRFPLSIDEVKAKAKDRIVSSATSSAQNALVRHYSLQNAESGLAADYIKRKHVVRVRAEGEQFLLQAKDDRGVIDLIEALQAATNVALDLDARPLPKFITLPRRRRRRRRPVEGDAAATAAGAAGGVAAPTNGATGTPPSGGVIAAGDRMGDMLAEEQNAYAQRASGTVM
ncbi:hypothetical protein JCM3774_005231 [Rhodotorula dairenensis]